MTKPRRITYAEWEAAVRHGYASTRDGEFFVLALDKETQATTLERVTIDMMTDRLHQECHGYDIDGNPLPPTPTITIDAYLRRRPGELEAGKATLEYLDRYATGRNSWWLAGTIVELGRPRHTDIAGQNDLDDGPAMEMAPLVIPAREILRMARIEEGEAA